MYLCPTLGLRVDGKFSVHKFQPLSHTGDTQPASQDCHLGVKANSRIAHGEMDCIQRSEQFNLEVPLSTVLHRIKQRFLQHPEEGKANLQRRMAWHVKVFEVNFDSLFFGESFAKGFG